jgi:hypothetical protein
MTRDDHRWMRQSGFFVLCVFLIGMLSVFPASCSYRQTVGKAAKTVTKTTKEITRKIRFSDDDLQRIAALVSFENRSLYQNEDFAQLFRSGIPEYLRNKCDDVTTLDEAAGQDFELIKELPRLPSGQVDNFVLASNGRALGLNSVIIGSLDYIGLIDETEGFILKSPQHFIQILVRVEVYDTETGTKIVDDSFKRKLQVDQLDYDMMRAEGQLKLPDISETLNDLLEEMGERICWAIEDQPWNGFIASLAEDKIIISAGSIAGLEPGDELEVFDNSRIIKGRDGQQFFVHGPKTGRIRIVSVNPRTSEAIALSDNGITAGSAVRVK